MYIQQSITIDTNYNVQCVYLLFMHLIRDLHINAFTFYNSITPK